MEGLKRNSCMRRNVKLPRETKKHTHLAGYQQEDKKSKLCRISQRSIRVSTQPLIIIPNFFDRKVIETEEVISNHFSKYNNNFLLSF